MERLTKRLNDGRARLTDLNQLLDPDELYKLIERLAAYEDTGLDPDEIISVGDMAKIACALHELNAYKDIGPIDHIRDLLQAEKDGRLLVLPCGENAELERDGYTFKADHWNHTLSAFREAPETNSGLQVALFNIKEAKAALKGGTANA